MVKCCHLVLTFWNLNIMTDNREFNSLAYFTVNPSLQKTSTRKFLQDFGVLLFSEFLIASVKKDPLTCSIGPPRIHNQIVSHT